MDFTLHATTVLDAPTASVLAVLTDIERLPSWNTEITKVLQRPDVVEVGAQWVVEIHAMKNRWNSRSQVSELDVANGRFAYRSVSDDGNPSFADWCWQVTDVAGRTRVHVTVEAHPRTFWRRHLLSRLRPSGLAKAMDRSLATLREQVATRSSMSAHQYSEER